MVFVLLLSCETQSQLRARKQNNKRLNLNLLAYKLALIFGYLEVVEERSIIHRDIDYMML